MRPSKFLSALCSLLLALFLLTAAIAVPILCRPLYYAQIDALDLTENTGWDEETIRGAYDQVMDYLVGNAPFGTGKLKWSESGRAHFADCRVLFRLDFALLGVSAAGLLLLGALRWGKRISPAPLLRPQSRLLGPCRDDGGPSGPSLLGACGL